jgi:exopolysaccharide production protein ExoZ
LSGTTPTALPSAARHTAALDGLRGFAVLLVFCVHAAGTAAILFLGTDLDVVVLRAVTSDGERLLYWLHRSHHGVFLFFVLSGFLIGRMWWPRAALSYRTFAWRRTLRIYPAFLVAFAASLAFAYASGNWQPPDWPRIAGNLLLLNGLPDSRVQPFNPVTWSLFYEMVFYLVFPVLLLGAMRAGRAPAQALPFLGIAVPALAVTAGASPLHLCWSLLFCGVAAAAHEGRLRAITARIPAPVVVLAYLAVTTAGLFDVVAPTTALLAFGAVAVLVLGQCLAGANALARLLARRPLVLLGRVSYSFYLLHWMVVVLVARALTPHRDRLGAFPGTVTLFVVAFALSALVATALWWLAERPYFARRKTGKT